MAHSADSIADGVFRNGSLSGRAPSPPYVHVPMLANLGYRSSTIRPTYALAAPDGLSEANIDTITGGRVQVTINTRVADEWRFEDRRKAHAILDYLYLGPTSVVRDHAWLQKEGITMLLVARDISMVGMRSLSIEKAVAELGLETTYVNLVNSQELIRNFPSSVNAINEHILRRNTIAGLDPTAKPGKVLVVCETGSDRSAAVVAAYVMAMYDCDMIRSIQFVSSQRFCVSFDESIKYLLIAYEDLLKAKTMTTLARGQENATPTQQGSRPSRSAAIKKRGFEDTLDGDGDGDHDMDEARYEDRPTFAPFMQGGMDS